MGVQFQKSRAFIRPDGSYLICMNSFFAGRLASSENDLKILRGVIAEREGVDPQTVRIAIEPIDAATRGDLAAELAGIIDSI